MKSNDDISIIDLNFQQIDHAIASFLIKSKEGNVLIETGPDSSFSQLEKELKNHQVEINEIRHTLITHIHLDHAGAAWRMAEKGSDIYLHPLGKTHMHNPEKLISSASRIYGDQMDSLWGTMKGIPEKQLTEMNDEQEITVGDASIKALHTPGHAVHHIAWQYQDVLFTGDVAGVKIGGQRVVPPCPPPDINIEDWIESINKIRAAKPSKLYLTHFGIVENIEGHLQELEEILWDWANWMKPKFENQENPEEIVPEFQGYVAEQLRSQGANEKEIIQYETANPSWMSVAGLLRYWKKKLN